MKENKYSYKVFLGTHDSRLKKGPAKEVNEYLHSRTLISSIPTFRFMIRNNLAHIVALYEKQVISREDSAKLLQTLRWIEKQGLEHFELDPNIEDLQPNLEAILISKLGEAVGGNLLTGRARNDVNYSSTILLLRNKMLDLLKELNSLRKLIIELADKHTGTLMPGYTHVQHAQPSTLGHYLSCVAEALETDFKRLEDAYAKVNMSPAEYGGGWGTGYPIDRQRVASLLGFEGIIENTRYAQTSFDRSLETLAALSILAVNISRFAEDIYFWCTYEFGFAEASDEYCGTSLIMPQKRNCVPLELYSSIANKTITALSRSATQVSRCSFGLLAYYSLSYREAVHSASMAIDDIIGPIKLLRGIVSTLTFNEDVMKECTGIHFTQGTDLADTLVREKGLSFRTAHRIVGALIREAIAQRKKPVDINAQMLDSAAIEITGKPVELPYKSLCKALDTMESIKSRKGFGGVAPEAVKESLKNRHNKLNEDIESVKEKIERVSKGQEELEKAVQKLINSTEQSALRANLNR